MQWVVTVVVVTWAVSSLRPRLLKVDPVAISVRPQSTPWLRQSGATRKVLLQPFWSPGIYTSVTGNLIMSDSVLWVLKDIWNLSKSQMPLKGKLLWPIIMVISNLKFHIPTSHKRHNDGQRALFNISQPLMETAHLFKIRLWRGAKMSRFCARGWKSLSTWDGSSGFPCWW